MIRWMGWIAALGLLSWISVWPQSPSTSEAGAPPAAKRSSRSTPQALGRPEAADDRSRARRQRSLRRLSRRHLSVVSAALRWRGPAVRAIDNVIPADFVHSKSGVHYRIYSEANRVWLNFDRPDDPAVRGKRELLYYIGSGRRGLSYLFRPKRLPVSNRRSTGIAAQQRWDMAPAYQNATEIPLNLPAVTSCLRCHVSGMRAPVKGTENLYPNAGISPCRRQLRALPRRGSSAHRRRGGSDCEPCQALAGSPRCGMHAVSSGRQSSD